MANGTTVLTPLARPPPAKVTVKFSAPLFSFTAPLPLARVMATVTGSSSAMVVDAAAP